MSTYPLPQARSDLFPRTAARVTSKSKERHACVGIFLLCVVANLWFSSIGWHHNLRELHEFRQTQTAVTARAIQQEGWHLAYPTPLFGPPWSVPLEFPVYQICVAKAATLTGLPLEIAGRLISLCFLYLALPAFFLVLRFAAIAPDRRWLFLGLLLVTPVYLFYSRTFLIESTALCASAWFLHAYCRALETSKTKWTTAAAFIGSAAALVKITTFVVFLFPAIAFTLQQVWLARPKIEGSWRDTLILGVRGLAIAIFALSIGKAWIAYGDHIKASNPLSRFLVSGTMGEWNYGTLAQRVDSAVLKTLATQTLSAVLAPVAFGILIVCLVRIARGFRAVIAVLTGCYAAGPLLFTNLYFLHDYYFYAAGIFLLAALAVGWNSLLDSPRVAASLKWTVVIISLAAQLYSFANSYLKVQRRDDLPEPELARALNRATEPDDVVLYYGFMWDPLIPYASGRKAIMVIDEQADDEAAIDGVCARLPAGAIGAVAVTAQFRRDPAFLRRVSRKLGCAETPLIENAETAVFFAPRLLSNATSRLKAMGLNSFGLNVPADADYFGTKQRRYRVSDLDNPAAVAMFSPRPAEILAPFGIAVVIIDGRAAFNAHAPTEITFDQPSSAHHVRADFGISPGAYTGDSKTDGVVFDIEVIDRLGRSTVLFERSLRPATVNSDRGTQHVELDLPAPAIGRIIFRTLPGPVNDIAYDWAYWTGVEIK